MDTKAGGSRHSDGAGKPQPALSTSMDRSQHPVDLVHLARYTLGNRALELEILKLFSDQARSDLEKLRLSRTDKSWRDAAHTIKGSAMAIGAWGIVAAAREAEQTLGEAMTHQRSRLIEHVAIEIDAALDFIEIFSRNQLFRGNV